MDGDVDADRTEQLRGPRPGRDDHVARCVRLIVGDDAHDPVAFPVERQNLRPLDDPRPSPFRCFREAADIAVGLHLGVERTIGGADHGVGQDRRQGARLITVDQADVDPIRLTLVHELAERLELRLGVDVEKTAFRPKTEVVVEDARQLLELPPQMHHEVDLGPDASRVEPDVTEVSTGRARGELVRLDERHR